MPWKNPKCEKCGGPTKQVKWLETNPRLKSYSSSKVIYGRALFKCKSCGHEFLEFGHRHKREK